MDDKIILIGTILFILASIGTVHADDPVNVALASNGATASGGWSPRSINDGETTGYTGDTGYAGALWNRPITVSMDNIYEINAIHVLLWDLDSRYYQYKVETSIDNKVWTTVIDKTTGSWRSWQKDSIDPIEAKYIRITGTYNTANIGFHVVEMEAYTSPDEAPLPHSEPTPSPDLIWRGDWESGTTSPWERKTEGVEIVTDPVRTGKYAARFSVSPGQQAWSVGNERSEVLMYSPREEEGDEYYYAWSTKLGENWRPVSAWGIFTQWHAVKAIRPAVALMVTKTDYVYLGMCTGDVSGNERTALLVDDSIGVKMRKDVWNDFVARIKWTTSRNGLVEIWYKTENDESFKKVYTRTGVPTLQYGDNDPSVIYTKHQGLYRSKTGYTQTIYHDGYRIGRTFDSVLY